MISENLNDVVVSVEDLEVIFGEKKNSFTIKLGNFERSRKTNES